MAGNNIVPNVSGRKIAALRKSMEPRMSQDTLAKKLQREGIDVDKGTVQRIEAGKRAVKSRELYAIALILKTSPESLRDDEAPVV